MPRSTRRAPSLAATAEAAATYAAETAYAAGEGFGPFLPSPAEVRAAKAKRAALRAAVVASEEAFAADLSDAELSARRAEGVTIKERNLSRYDDEARAEAEAAAKARRDAEANDPLNEYGPALYSPAPAPLSTRRVPAPGKVAARAAKPAGEKPAKTPRASRGVNLAAPGFKPLPAREGTKTDILIRELARGTTIPRLIDLLSADGKTWLPESVKVGFGFDVKKKGYGVRTEFYTDPDFIVRFDPEAGAAAAREALENGGNVTPVAVYFLVYPEGYSAPVPATPRKTADKAAA